MIGNTIFGVFLNWSIEIFDVIFFTKNFEKDAEMSLLEGQFRETLKILTYEFVMSVSKMCALHEGQLPLTSTDEMI